MVVIVGPRRARARGALATLVCAALAAARGAAAQSSPALPAFDARTWRPPVAADASMILEPVLTPHPLEWNVGAWATYALDPVIVRGAAPSLHPVENQVATDLIANVGLGARLALGLDLPVAAWQTGDAGAPHTSLGDLTLVAKATVLSNESKGLRAGFGLAALADVSLPTGLRSSFVGDGAATASFTGLAEYSLGIAAARASVGFRLRPDWRTGTIGGSDVVTVGNALPWALGLVLRPKALVPSLDPDDRQLWEFAAHGSLPAGPVAPFGWGSGPGATGLSPALLSLDDRVGLGRSRDAYLLLGAEVGLDSAIGVPALRAVISLGWAPRVHDRDRDGVPDDVDQCPDLPEDRDGIQDRDGCPEDDADGDGIPDEQDACPTVAGPPSSDPKRNGCPGAPPPVMPR